MIIREGGVAVAPTGYAVLGPQGQDCGCCGGPRPLCTGCGSGNVPPLARCTFSGITFRNTGCACGSFSLTWIVNPNQLFTLTRDPSGGNEPNQCTFRLTNVPAVERRSCSNGSLIQTYMLNMVATFIRNPGPPVNYASEIRMDFDATYGNLFRATDSAPSCLLDIQPFHEDQNDNVPNPTCTLFERHPTAVVTVSFQ